MTDETRNRVAAASPDSPVVVIGAGPAGLTAAHELTRRGVPTLVLEQDDQVGGLARTVSYRGFRFDIGGHRFFTKVPIVQDLWRSMLGSDLLVRPRLSRIYYRKKFFSYPLKPFEALRTLGIFTSAWIFLSYLRAKLFPIRPEVSFADWVSNRFGRRLFNIFFKGYTEKVWGIPCETIGAQWAAQRIKGLSLRTAVLSALFPRSRKSGAATVKTLIDQFEYPRFGPGMMWEAFHARVERDGGRVEFASAVTRLQHNGRKILTVETQTRGECREHKATEVISTMPIRRLVHALSPTPPAAILAAADRLKYRDFLTVALVVNQEHVFPDNWIYVHDTSVSVGRIQNFKNWSPEMVPDSRQTCLGLEYFCNEGDELWSMDDRDLVQLASRELEAIRLVQPNQVVDGVAVRMPKAYPVYDEGYLEALEVIKAYLEGFENLQLVGRNGMHKYNNQDHSMLTAILAARNLFGESHDLWAINADDEYHEEIAAETTDDDLRRHGRALASTQPSVPIQVRARVDK